MRKRDLEAQVQALTESITSLEFNAELRESAFQRQLAKEQEGWASLDSATKRNRTWADVKKNLEDCYRAWTINPLAKSYIDYMRLFVIGKGTQITAGDEEGDDATDRLDAFCELNEWDNLEKQVCEELSRDGEVFIRFHDVNKMELQSTVATLSLIDPLEITSIDCPEMGKPNRYRREWTRVVSTNDSGTQTTESADEWIDSGEIYHIKVNTSHNELRGRSDLLVILPWLLQLKRWLDDMSRRNYMIGSFVWDVECSGGVKPSTVTAQYTAAPAPGTVIAHGPNEKWNAVSPDLRWSDSVEGARALKLMVCAGYKMPESWFGDTGESNLATTQALAMPTLRSFLDRQDFLKYHFEQVLKRGARVENVEVSFPEIVSEEAQSKAQALNALSQAFANFQTSGVMSRESMYEILRQFVDTLDAWSDDTSGVGEKRKIETEDAEDTEATAQGRKLAPVPPRPALEEPVLGEVPT